VKAFTKYGQSKINPYVHAVRRD